MALKSEKNGINRCPNCGSSDVKLDVKTGKLKCNFCRSEFEGKKANARGGVEKLKGETVSGGAELIIPDEKVIVTLKCPACGAEVVINTDESVSARCHWCRHTLSLNEKMKNGAVPDLVLPFSYEKEKAEENIRQFVKKRKFFAHPKFRREFKAENVMGVYLPYMVVDVNAHASMAGEAEHLIRTYTSGGKHKTRYYDAEAFSVTREFDLLVDDLTLESSSKRRNQDIHANTNNVINAIMPFDTENCEEWTPNYLHGYASERRDTNVNDLRDQLNLQVGDIARYRVKESMTYYNRGAKWTKEDIETKGSIWKAAYLPVWLYSYLEETKNGKMLHYVAVNGRTGETMGSVPINKTRLRIVAALVELVGIFLGWQWMKFWLGVDLDADDDNPFIFGLAGLTPGFIYYWVMVARYRNMNARHKHEAETPSEIKDLKKTDVSIGRRNHLRNARIAGANDSVVKGVLASGGKKMMGEKMANWLGIGRMTGTKPTDTQAGQDTPQQIAKSEKRAGVGKVIAIIAIIFVAMAIFIGVFSLMGRVKVNIKVRVNDLQSTVEKWKESYGDSISVGKEVGEMHVYTKSNSQGYLGFDFTNEDKPKISAHLEGESDVSIRSLSGAEFALEEEAKLHRELKNSGLRYKAEIKPTILRRERSLLYVGGDSKSDSNVFCELHEKATTASNGGYDYDVNLQCIQLDRDEVDYNGIEL